MADPTIPVSVPGSTVAPVDKGELLYLIHI